MIIGPNYGEPVPLSQLKRWLPQHRVRAMSRNLATTTKQRSRSQAHERKVRRERGW